MLREAVREAKVEEELFRVIKNVLEKKNHEIEGISFQDLEPQYPVDSGAADLVLFTDRPRKPILVVECKRKGFSSARSIMEAVSAWWLNRRRRGEGNVG